MIKLFLIGCFCTLSLTVMSQQDPHFDNLWKKVTELEQKGLTASAQTQVQQIYQLAIAQKNEPQQIKGAMFLMKYRTVLEEDSEVSNLLYLDSLISITSGPAKQVLYSLKGELLESYIKRNIYAIKNRTRVDHPRNEKMDTWSLEELADSADAAFQLSLQPLSLLQSTPVEAFLDILEKGNARHIRPTLYDLLAHRALSYYTSIHALLTEPKELFTLSQNELFAPAEMFMHVAFNTPDSSAPYYRSVVLFQHLLKTHHHTNPAAFADADIKRLYFFKQYALHEQADNLYLQALIQLEKANAHDPVIAAQALYLQAVFYYHRGNSAQVEFIRDWTKAKSIAADVIKKYPESPSAANAHNLILKITLPNLQLVTEETLIPHQPALALVRYTNVPKLHFRLIRLTDAEWSQFQRLEDKKGWEKLIGLKPEKSWSVDLPDPGDYRTHTTEIAIPPTPSGNYVLLADTRGDFSTTRNLLIANFVQVNSLMCIRNNYRQYHVVNRSTGFPIAGAEVTATIMSQESQPKTGETPVVIQLKTNQAGMFEAPIPDAKKSQKTDIVVQYKDEKLYLAHWHYYYNGYQQDDSEDTEIILLYTDRSIYRPGQTVYFKGILLSNSIDQKNTVLKNHIATVELEDNNGETLQSATFTSNEYGSFSGSFTLPQTGLTGEYNLYHDESDTYLPFRVEEYKRPTFKNSVQLPNEKNALRDTVRVKGNAVSYAGVALSNMKVTYTIKRKVNYPFRYWSGNGRRMPYYSNERVIGTGETQTDTEGNYTIAFVAMPDESINPDMQPYFNFVVQTDITDLQGETRSANVTVNIGYQEILLTPAGPETILPEQLTRQLLSSETLNGIFKSVPVKIQVEQMDAPTSPLRTRLWEVPDQYTMTKDAFKKQFPFDPYGDESNRLNWKTRSIAMQFTDSTRENKTIRWPAKKLSAGWYRITYTYSGKQGKPIIAEQWINISGTAPVHEPIQLFTDKDMAEPGETLNLTVKTGWETVWLIQSTDRMTERNISNYHTLTSGKNLQQKILLKESDRGGMSVQYVFVYQNRMYQAGKDVIIPWSNKDLSVQFSTFRDLTQPGQTETFTIKIQGDKKEKVASEALISMYDVSLDQFYPHQWNLMKSIFPQLSERTYWTALQVNTKEALRATTIYPVYKKTQHVLYDKLMSWAYTSRQQEYYERDAVSDYELSEYDGVIDDANFFYSRSRKKSEYTGAATSINDVVVAGVSKVKMQPPSADNTPVFSGKVRTDFRETAFFYPHLITDEKGDISFTFTMPESLTQWRMMVMAHTTELRSGYIEKNITTRLPLMVQMNAPRFFREGDQLEIPVKVSNTTDSAFSGTIQLELIDAQTTHAIDGWFQNVFPSQHFTVEAQQSSVVHFPVQIPVNYGSALKIRAKAVSHHEQFSDGEENVYPVMTNRTLVTETLPFTMRNSNELHLTFDKLAASSGSSTLKHHALTLEYTSNPIWYAIQALPYLMEFPYECSEQIFSRYYANSLASYIIQKTPRIQRVFEQWQQYDSAALMSNLLKNPELKSALLEETPWVLEAREESVQKKNIALLFNLSKLATEQERTLQKLAGLQNANGSFSWFANGPENPWITQHILTGLGRLNQLQTPDSLHPTMKTLIDKGLPYLNGVLIKAYQEANRNKKHAGANHLSPLVIHHLYMRTLYPDAPVGTEVQKAVQYFLKQEKKYWNSQSLYMKAMIAITLHATEPKTSKAIVRSLKENAIYHKELGMYWKELQNGGYFWHQAPVETMSMIMTAFHKITPEDERIQDLSVWLLKNKQTQHWKTTKATTDAVYALLLANTSLSAEPSPVHVQLGNHTLNPSPENVEPGTGYFKTTIQGKEIDASMASLQITRTNGQPKDILWGGVYWQYFEDLDQITRSTTSALSLKRAYFVEHATEEGAVLKPIMDGASVPVGSKIVVRVILQSDRDMEYLHLKDMRVSGMEPVNVLSGYKYSHNLGYYESTKDLASHFFIDYLPKGTYVFEYRLFATHAGNFSTGISSIQSMYAPEFNSHSDGIRIEIEEAE